MFRIVIEVDAPAGTDPQGVKEKPADYFAHLGDVRVAEVREVPPEQLKLEG